VLSVVRNRRKAESVTIANRLLNLDPVLFAVTLALGGAGRVQKDSSVYKVLVLGFRWSHEEEPLGVLALQMRR
jgi:hypothetical protein